MKAIIHPFVYFFLIFSYVSCSKSKDNVLPDKNTVTYNTDGKIYTLSGKNSVHSDSINYIDCSIKQVPNQTQFSLIVDVPELRFGLSTENSGFFFGYGTFIIASGRGFFYEKFAGGRNYQVKGGKVNLKESSDTKIIGDYELQLFNSYSTKAVTGTFEIYDPIKR